MFVTASFTSTVTTRQDILARFATHFLQRLNESIPNLAKPCNSEFTIRPFRKKKIHVKAPHAHDGARIIHVFTPAERYVYCKKENHAFAEAMSATALKAVEKAIVRL